MEAKGEVLAAGAGEMRPVAVEAGAKAPLKVASGRLTKEQWAEAERLYRSGLTAGEVGRRFGIAAQTIYVRVGATGKKAEQRRRREEAGGLGETEIAARRREWDAGAKIASVVIEGLSTLIEKVAEAAELRTGPPRLGDGKIARRKHFSPAVWAAAKRDYVEGDFTAAAIEDRYGIPEETLRAHAWRGRWDKTVSEPPAPLLPHDDPEQVDAAGESDWARVAHAAQLAPAGAWSTWLFQGGRGAGKTRAGAEWLAARAEATPDGRFAIVAPTEHDLREVMIEGVSGLRSLPGRERPKYEPSRRRLRWKNGAVAYGFSAEEPERLRGPQFEAAWADEFCAWKHAEKVLSNLRLGMRLGSDPRLVVTTTPKPVAALRKLREETTCVMTQAGTRANAANLSAGFIAGIEAIYGGTRLAEQELGGVLVDGDGALWKAEWIARGRGLAPKRFERVVVAVDPPAGLEGSACGIVVAGRTGERAYVLADRTVHGLTPLGWAERAWEAAQEFGARTIVAEANQGGEMVRHTLQTAGAKCRLKLVRATAGKAGRAQPVSALYEKGLVRHCGTFVDLEEEMMALGPAEAEGAFDRADALVWALTELMLVKRPAVPRID